MQLSWLKNASGDDSIFNRASSLRILILFGVREMLLSPGRSPAGRPCRISVDGVQESPSGNPLRIPARRASGADPVSRPPARPREYFRRSRQEPLDRQLFRIPARTGITTTFFCGFPGNPRFVAVGRHEDRRSLRFPPGPEAFGYRCGNRPGGDEKWMTGYKGRWFCLSASW